MRATGSAAGSFADKNAKGVEQEPASSARTAGAAAAGRVSTAAEQPARASVLLPVGWEQRMSGSKGKIYYYHKQSGITTWMHPLAPLASEKSDNGTAADAAPAVLPSVSSKGKWVRDPAREGAGFEKKGGTQVEGKRLQVVASRGPGGRDKVWPEMVECTKQQRARAVSPLQGRSGRDDKRDRQGHDDEDDDRPDRKKGRTKMPKLGSVHAGTVRGVKDFGCFVRLDYCEMMQDHLLHASRMTGKIFIGDRVRVKICHIRQTLHERRVFLTMMDVDQDKDQRAASKAKDTIIPADAEVEPEGPEEMCVTVHEVPLSAKPLQCVGASDGLARFPVLW